MKQALILIFSLALLSGCAHYQLGQGNQTTYSSVYVLPVINQSMIPQAQATVNEALVRQFIRAGSTTVENKANAEVILQVTLKDYQKNIAASRTDDTGRARSLGLTLRANATLSKPDGTVLHSQDFEASYEFYADGGVTNAEAAALPKLAEMLASKIHSAVISNW